jgi:hypothetical protein
MRIVGQVPSKYRLDPQLGKVDTQRSLSKKGMLNFEREAKLDELGFEFSVRNKAK